MMPASPSGVLRGRAPAKINLGLAVTGARPDGYHELTSIFLRLDLADTLMVTPSRPGLPDTLRISGDPDCPVEDNLVLRALAALRAALPGGAALPGLAITLDKRIPMGGGLAGGSTDAATALRLAARAWAVPASATELLTLGARLGADVPFFVAGHAAALVTGIGERVAPLPALRARVGVLLVTPGFGMATPAVFGAFDRLGAHPSGSVRLIMSLAARWRAGLDGPALAAQAPALRDANDLWPAVTALAPRMAQLRDLMEDILVTPALLTGSGSTLVALYPSGDEARHAARRLTLSADPRVVTARVVATTDDQSPHDEGSDP